MSKRVCLVLDNGAYTVKTGLSNSTTPKVIMNCGMKVKSERRRVFIGDQIDKCHDPAGLYFVLAFQKGYILNWTNQKIVWDYIFSKDCLPIKFKETPVIVTEPLFNFQYNQEGMQQLLFGEYEVHSILTVNPTDLCDYNYRKTNNEPKATIIVDTGYSFTHVVPYLKGEKVMEAIRRLDVGGKLLTNQLKEIISYRQLNVMEETYVMNQAKEDACFVTQNFMKDMETSKKSGAENPIKKEYVLPDYVTTRRGFLRDPEPPQKDSQYQSLILNNERFSVPELLFTPSDVGINQCGIAELIVDSVKACPEVAWPHLLGNIVVVGGCATFPGFKDRLYTELRSLIWDHIPIKIFVPENPVTYAWQGGTMMAKDSSMQSRFVPFKSYNVE